jgi:hypothetical protein
VVEIWIDIIVPSLGALLSIASANISSDGNPPRAAFGYGFSQAVVFRR